MTNIVLIGMMGSGKSTLGRVLSGKTGMRFLETDSIIEEQKNMTIPHIFEQYGESYFRALETDAARYVSEQRGAVISTGGGMVLDPRNMALLKGFVVYLRCEPLLLHERTAEDGNRPLLTAADDRLAQITKLLAEREPLYSRYSNFTLDDTGGLLADRLAEMILDEYNSYQRPES